MQSTDVAPYEQLGLVAYELQQWEAARVWYAKALRAAAQEENYWSCAMICHQLSAAFRAEQRLDEAIAWSVLAFAARRMTPFEDGSDRVASEIALASAVRTTDLTDTWAATTGVAPPPGLKKNLETVLSEGTV